MAAPTLEGLCATAQGLAPLGKADERVTTSTTPDGNPLLFAPLAPAGVGQPPSLPMGHQSDRAPLPRICPGPPRTPTCSSAPGDAAPLRAQWRQTNLT